MHYMHSVMAGLGPPAGPEPLRYGGGPAIHLLSRIPSRTRWSPGKGVTTLASLLLRVAGTDRLAGSSRFLVLLVVVDLGELGIDDVVLLAVGCTAVAVARLLLGGLLVHRLAELHRGLCQRVGLGRDRGCIVALQGFLEVGHGVLDRATLGLADLRAVFGKRLLSRVDESLGMVLRLDLRLALLVLLGVSFGILDHLLDVVLGEPA